MKLPIRDVQQFEVEVEAGPIANFLLEVRAFRQRRIQRNFFPRALDDKGAAFFVGHVIVATLPDRDTFVEFLRPEADLPRRANIAPPLELDAEIFAHRAFPAIAPHKIARANRLLSTIKIFDRCVDAAPVLGEVRQFTAKTHGDVWGRFRYLLQQGLKIILRDKLVWLQRFGSIRAGGDLPPMFRDTWIMQTRHRRIAQPSYNEHVHRSIRRISQRADAIRDTDPPIELHRPRVGAIHLGILLRGRIFLDQKSPRTTAAKVDGQGQSNRAGANYNNIKIAHNALPEFCDADGNLLTCRPSGRIDSYARKFRDPLLIERTHRFNKVVAGRAKPYVSSLRFQLPFQIVVLGNA